MTTTVTAKNKAANALTPTTISVHSADPGALGANNIIGTAQSCTFAAAVDGVRALSNQPQFTIPAGITVTHTVTKDLDGDVIDISALAAPETYSNGGTHTIQSGSITVS